MRLLKSSCQAVFVAITALTVICFVRTFVLTNLSHKTLAGCSEREGDAFIELTDKRWQLLRESLRIKTISREGGQSEYKELERMTKFITEAYPDIFESPYVAYEIVNKYSLLIHVEGGDRELLPYVLAGHLDVVPVTESRWSTSPFSAKEDQAKTKVYGRGALDNKASVMAQLAALELLLQRGTRPRRSFYLAYGHDEEIMGYEGAAYIAKTLRARGVDRLHFLLDEGMFVARNMMPGVNADVAIVGVTEKGYFNVNVSVEFHGGHSSIPGKESAVGILSGAISRLQSNPMPGTLDELLTELLVSFAPEVKFPLNVLFCNLWLFKPLVLWAFENNKNMQALVRTTTATTVLQAGTKYNVIPSSAWAVVNHRVHPQDTIEKVIEYNKRIINDDRVKLASFDKLPSHPISPYDRTSSLAYQVLTDSIEQVFEKTLIAPGMLFATTDTKHYLTLTENIYRFNPFVLEPKDTASIHAENEAITKENFRKMMNFYFHLMQNAERTELRELSETKREL